MTSDPTSAQQTEVLAAYGEAMAAAQELELQMVGLVGVQRELTVWEDKDPNDVADLLEGLWRDLFTWPAGRIARALAVSEPLATEVKQAVAARNLLAHHYLRDRAGRLGDEHTAERAIANLAAAAVRFEHLAQRIEIERGLVMHGADRTDDHLTSPREAARLELYDPNADDDVPREPFEDAV